ncbi:uncharacterized protein LOC121841193 isoform X1 [Oncorhynchus tshawytscha]|uniref:uncharacterized protein LOC121841193 isoform X1 n=1 Tax=Oncorhynchus tshawytscha TaxID=74940 RepID=UPI001C3E1C31|nr:uncharacterized protein LOC121841193 isoform X1 [Oncorhynchus tshawytscha]
MATSNNPRKFSEKIALHNQKQAEETAAFEEVMKDLSITRAARVLQREYSKDHQSLLANNLQSLQSREVSSAGGESAGPWNSRAARVKTCHPVVSHQQTVSSLRKDATVKAFPWPNVGGRGLIPKCNKVL